MIEQYSELIKDVNNVKESLNLDSIDTALLLMIYDKLLEID